MFASRILGTVDTLVLKRGEERFGHARCRSINRLMILGFCVGRLTLPGLLAGCGPAFLAGELA